MNDMAAADVVVIASTNGSVIDKLLAVPYFKERVRSVVSDRQCGAIEVARKHGISATVFPSPNGLVFSNTLLEEFRNRPPTLFVSFYTRLFVGPFVEFAKNRLVNLHPSILPACPGQDGFGDTVRSGSLFMGATIHLVDKGMDTGYPIIQSAAPLDRQKNIHESRHRIFVQQCKMLLQVVRWVEEQRLEIRADGSPEITGATFEVGEFSPNLDFNIAVNFDVAISTYAAIIQEL